jgi:hypothetical protein
VGSCASPIRPTLYGNRTSNLQRSISVDTPGSVGATNARFGSEGAILPSPADVRFGSKADIEAGAADVRFTPESGHRLSSLECPLSAKSRHDPSA